MGTGNPKLEQETIKVGRCNSANNGRKPQKACVGRLAFLVRVCLYGFLLWVRIAYACPTITSRCNTLPQKAHSKTESQHMSADQQCKNSDCLYYRLSDALLRCLHLCIDNARTGAHKQGPKQPAMTRNTECALRRREQSNTHNIKQP